MHLKRLGVHVLVVNMSIQPQANRAAIALRKSLHLTVFGQKRFGKIGPVASNDASDYGSSL